MSTSTNDWKFGGAPWWDDTDQSMKFNLKRAGSYRTCTISQAVLNDYFKTENSKDAAVKNYLKHSSQIRLLAIRLIKTVCQMNKGRSSSHQKFAEKKHMNI